MTDRRSTILICNGVVVMCWTEGYFHVVDDLNNAMDLMLVESLKVWNDDPTRVDRRWEIYRPTITEMWFW